MYKLDVLCLIPKWYITKWKSAAASVEGLCVARPGFLEFLYVLQYDVVQGAVAVAYLAHHQPHAQILLLVQLLHGLAVVFNVRILSHLSKRDRLFRVLIRNGNPLNRDFWLSKDTAKDSTELATTFLFQSPKIVLFIQEDTWNVDYLHTRTIFLCTIASTLICLFYFHSTNKQIWCS